jgi:hypothetical protein
MLKRGELPGIRVGHRWIISRQAYLHWEETASIRTTLVVYSQMIHGQDDEAARRCDEYRKRQDRKVQPNSLMLAAAWATCCSSECVREFRAYGRSR